MLEYQINRESGKCPARGISEGSRENPGMDDYMYNPGEPGADVYISIVRQKPGSGVCM